MSEGRVDDERLALRGYDRPMIARFRVLLPFTLSVQMTPGLSLEKRRDDRGNVTVYPPMRMARQPDLVTDPDGVIHALLEPPDTEPTPGMGVIDNNPVSRANFMQVDVERGGFDRRKSRANSEPDTEAEGLEDLCFDAVNSVLDRLRLVTRLRSISRLAKALSLFVIEYLSDDGKPLEEEEGLYRVRGHAHIAMFEGGISESVWRRVLALSPVPAILPSANLWLDATRLVPDIGPSLVLAAAAIETRIESVLNELASTSAVPAPLWAWLMDRGDHRKEPSTAEQLSVLLRSLTGRSLQDEPHLWEAFKNVRAARNSYLHQGTVIVGLTGLTTAQASTLLDRCGEVLEWLDALLPPGSRALQPVEPVTFTRAWGFRYSALEADYKIIPVGHPEMAVGTASTEIPEERRSKAPEP